MIHCPKCRSEVVSIMFLPEDRHQARYYCASCAKSLTAEEAIRQLGADERRVLVKA